MFAAGMVVLFGVAIWVFAGLTFVAAPDPNQRRVREAIVYLLCIGLLFIAVGGTSMLLAGMV